MIDDTEQDHNSRQFHQEIDNMNIINNQTLTGIEPLGHMPPAGMGMNENNNENGADNANTAAPSDAADENSDIERIINDMEDGFETPPSCTLSDIDLDENVKIDENVWNINNFD